MIVCCPNISLSLSLAFNRDAVFPLSEFIIRQLIEVLSPSTNQRL